MDHGYQSLASHFVGALEEVIGKPGSVVALHEPEFAGNEWAYVKECIDTGWVSSVGKFVDQFEKTVAEFSGARHAVAVVNGTAALHLALQLVGVRPGEEVIIPTLSFVGTANGVAHCGATPHFVDVDDASLGIDPHALDRHLREVAELSPEGAVRNRRTGKRIAAIVPMHAFGHPVDMESLVDVASRWKLEIVEDAAESLGSYIGTRHTGTFGRVGILSFNGNKVVTTGGGGAILTGDAELARHAKHLTTTAKVPHRWEYFHDEVAYNYRLPNINAALGCAQMERLPDFLARKRRLAERYADAFSRVDGMKFVGETAGRQSNFWLNAVRLNEPNTPARDALLASAIDAGYQCRPAWTLLHKLPMYANAPRAELSVAAAVEASLINIPSSARLGGRFS